MTLRTELCRTIGIDLPIIQAAMAGIGPRTQPELAAAVSRAGGLGMIGHPSLLLEAPDASGERLETLTAQVIDEVFRGLEEAIRLTDGEPLAVNVRVGAEQPEAEKLLEALLTEREQNAPLAKQLRVVTTSAGSSSCYGLNERIRASGLLHFHAVSTVAQARRAERDGVDGVIATSFEAAGHIGKEPVSTVTLVPAIARAVDVPVIAAGGIADGRGLAAALLLGAQAVYVGTRFVASTECSYHAAVKQRICQAKDVDSVVIDGFFGPMRTLTSEFPALLQQLDAEGLTAVEKMRVEGDAMARGSLEGDVEGGIVPGGMGSVLIEEVRPAAELVGSMIEEAETALQQMVRQP